MVSVIIAAYNVEKYIEECIHSILRQAYPDIELIVVDDGSTDATGALCRRALEGHANARYIRQENQGVAAARNHGIEIARGEFIMFVDGDDCLTPDIIERLLARTDEETDIACCTCAVFGSDVPERRCSFYPEDFEARTIEEREKLFLQLIDLRLFQQTPMRTAIGVPWGKLYRTELLRQNNLRFPPLRRMQDNIFNMYAFAAARKIVYLNEPLYRYRRDHIAGYQVSPDIRRAVLEAREEFFALHPEFLTAAVQREFYYEKMRYLGASLKVFATELSAAEARAMARALCNVPIYARFLREKPRWHVPARYRLTNALAAMGCYRTLLMLARFAAK